LASYTRRALHRDRGRLQRARVRRQIHAPRAVRTRRSCLGLRTCSSTQPDGDKLAGGRPAPDARWDVPLQNHMRPERPVDQGHWWRWGGTGCRWGLGLRAVARGARKIRVPVAASALRAGLRAGWDSEHAAGVVRVPALVGVHEGLTGRFAQALSKGDLPDQRRPSSHVQLLGPPEKGIIVTRRLTIAIRVSHHLPRLVCGRGRGRHSRRRRAHQRG
jgi:hypothetical protein